MNARSTILLLICTAVLLPVSAGASTGSADSSDLVYRYYAGSGYRLNPLLSFERLNDLVTAQDKPRARRLAHTLIALGSHRGGALVWTYDFPYAGAPAGWTSGFAPRRSPHRHSLAAAMTL